MVDKEGSIVLGDKPSVTEGFRRVEDLAVPWDPESEIAKDLLQSSIEEATEDVRSGGEGIGSLDFSGLNRGAVSVQELTVAGEAAPFRTVFLTEDDPFLYTPVMAAAATGWTLIVSPCFMPGLFRFLDRRYRRKFGDKKTRAQKEAEELERQQEEMRIAREKELEEMADRPVIRKKRKKSVWVSPEQHIADGKKRYTEHARAGAAMQLSKKQQAMQRRELGMTSTGKQAQRFVPKVEEKLGDVLGFEDKPVVMLPKPPGQQAKF